MGLHSPPFRKNSEHRPARFQNLSPHLSLSPCLATAAAKSPQPMTVDDGSDLPNDPFGPNFFPLLQTLASEGLQLQTAMEFDSIDRMLRSRALKDPSKFLEQANAILSSNLESTNFKETSCHLPEDSNQTGDANGVDNEHKRRPALGLRRAKFSFKPIQSQPVLLPDPVLSIDHLKDPDEFFAACERLENAEKELKKSRGKTLEGPVEKPKDRKHRHRRQGILGKMASYKHIYPKSAVEVNPVSSKEEMSQVSQFNMTLEAESNKSKPESATQPTESHEAEMVDIEVVAPKEKQDSQINILLEELLSTCVDLNGGEMVSLLQERLHVKPVALDELSFPDLDRNDIKAFEGSQSQPRKALADLKQGLRLTVSCKTPARKTSVKKQNKDESFRYPRSSSTPPRSPFASFSMLTKRVLQIDQPSDRFAFSVEPDGQAAERSCSFEGRVDKEDFLCPASPIHLEKGSLGSSDDSTQRNVGKTNDEMLSKMDVECNAENIAFSSKKVSLMDLAVPLDTPMEVDAYPQDKVKDLPPTVPLSQELEISLDVVTGTAQCSKDQPEPVDTYMDNTSSGFDNDIDVIPSEVHAHSRDKVNDMPTVVSSSQELESSHVVITGTAQCRDSQPEPVTAKCSEDRPESGTCLAADGHPEGTTDFFGLRDKSQEASSTVSQNKREVNGLRGKRTKKRQDRQSLAAAGTNFESGTRKSTRVKSRPLEYWRGERFLYGRIHESLPTVIGIKKASPGKSGAEPLLKVESFVSDEYAELVRLSALH